MGLLVRHAVGGTLRQVRMDQGRTLREVASDARVSLGYLSEVERGHKEASSELLASICDALDVRVSEILVDAGDVLRADEAIEDAADLTAHVAARDEVSPRFVIPNPLPMAMA